MTFDESVFKILDHEVVIIREREDLIDKLPWVREALTEDLFGRPEIPVSRLLLGYPLVHASTEGSHRRYWFLYQHEVQDVLDGVKPCPATGWHPPSIAPGLPSLRALPFVQTEGAVDWRPVEDAMEFNRLATSERIRRRELWRTRAPSLELLH